VEQENPKPWVCRRRCLIVNSNAWKRRPSRRRLLIYDEHDEHDEHDEVGVKLWDCFVCPEAEAQRVGFLYFIPEAKRSE